MSWDGYISSSLLGSQKVDQAAIFGINGNSQWAASSGFTVTTPEVEAIAAAYEDKSEPKKVQADGIHIAGVKYVVIKADDRSIYGMKGKEGVKEGVIVAKSKQAYIIAHYPNTVPAQSATVVVEGLADYLIGLGY